jgi:hypothetical protein
MIMMMIMIITIILIIAATTIINVFLHQHLKTGDLNLLP